MRKILIPLLLILYSGVLCSMHRSHTIDFRDSRSGGPSALRAPIGDHDSLDYASIDANGMLSPRPLQQNRFSTNFSRGMSQSNTLDTMVPYLGYVDGVQSSAIPWMNSVLEGHFINLSPEQQDFVTQSALLGNFDVGKRDLKLWRLFRSINDPFRQILKGMTAVLPSVSGALASYLDQPNSIVVKAIDMSTKLSGILLLLTEGLNSFATSRINYWSAITLSLQGMKGSNQNMNMPVSSTEQQLASFAQERSGHRRTSYHRRTLSAPAPAPAPVPVDMPDVIVDSATEYSEDNRSIEEV